MIYQKIASAYQELFPVQKGFIDFVLPEVGASPVLDLGCGPGLYLETWQNKDVESYGIELSPFLRAQSKESVRSSIICGDLEQPQRWIAYLPATFSLVYCIGNTLSYLDQDALKHLLKYVWQLLEPGGKFVFQTVNWPRIISDHHRDGMYAFPEKRISEGVFRRQYHWKPAAETVSFQLILEQKGQVLEESHTLFPKNPRLLRNLAGTDLFSQMDFLGNWKCESWSAQSESLIGVFTR